MALVAGSMGLALALALALVEQARIVAVVVAVAPLATAAMVGSIVGCSSYVCSTGTFLFRFFVFCFAFANLTTSFFSVFFCDSSTAKHRNIYTFFSRLRLLSKFLLFLPPRLLSL